MLFTVLNVAMPGLADSRLVFPRIVFQNGLFSGIAVSNPTSETATIKLTAYNSDGSRLAVGGTRNDVTPAAIPSGGQYLALAGQVFDPSSVLAGPSPKYFWVEVTSTTTGLAGFYIEGDSSITFQYGGDLGTHGTDLYLPAVENTGTTVTEISLVNADASDNGGLANVTVDFLRTDGTWVDSRSVNIAKAASIQGPVAAIAAFNQVPFDQVAALRVRSDRPVLCYGIVKPKSGKSPIALPAEDATTPAKTIYFPQLAEGGGWSTSIGVVNLDFTSQVVVDVTAYDSNGNIFVDPTITNPASVPIPPGGMLRRSFRDLFPFTNTSYKEGWLKVDASSVSINGFVEYGNGNNRSLVIAQLNPFQRSMFSHQAQSATCFGCPSYFTGLAVLNPGSLAANVEIFSLDAQGITRGRRQTILKPGQRTSQLLYQLVSESEGTSGGAIFVRSDRPVFTTELFAKEDVTALANVPPQQVTAAFDPRSNLANISPVPQLAVIETGKTRQFTVTGVAGGIQWSVGGSSGGDVGAISGTGLYAAPAKAPTPRTITIQAAAASGNNSGASSVDVVQREQLTGGLTVVTAVAYLQSLRRFFVAEQKLSPAPAPLDGFSAGTAETWIYEVVRSGGSTTNVLYLANPIPDTIAKMLPYDVLGKSYLLLAGRDSGQIYRLDVSAKDLKTVVSGLNQPVSMAFDPTTGNLLVAEAGAQRITIVKVGQITGVGATGGIQALSVPSIQGVAVDGCTGSVYISNAAGELVEYQGSARRVVETGLDHPTQLRAIWRTGFSCATALTIGIVEAGKVSLSFPRQQTPRVTLVENVQGVSDITILPEDNPFTSGGETSICVSQSSTVPNQGQVSDVPMGGAFQATPPDTPFGDEAIVPGTDPIGDTFDIGAQGGTTVPDIVSVAGSTQGTQSVITIKFAAPVTLHGQYLGPGLGYDGLRAFVFMRTNTGPTLTQYPVNFAGYFPFGDPGTYVFDSYIEVNPNTGVTYVTVAPSGYTGVKASAVGNTLTLSIPSAMLDLSSARPRVVVMVGNPSKISDVAPNNGLLELSSVQIVTSSLEPGAYSDYSIQWEGGSWYGLMGEDGSTIVWGWGDQDAFSAPNHVLADYMFFISGSVTYRHSVPMPSDARVDSLSYAVEVSSEYPGASFSWSSDLTVSVNGVPIGTWRIPGDPSGQYGMAVQRNKLSADSSQYGWLTQWTVDATGTYFEAKFRVIAEQELGPIPRFKISSKTLNDLNLIPGRPIAITLSVPGPHGAQTGNGGLNVYGDTWGDYPIDPTLTINYHRVGPLAYRPGS